MKPQQPKKPPPPQFPLPPKPPFPSASPKRGRPRKYPKTTKAKVKKEPDTRPRPFACTQCDRAYLKAANLSVHIRKVHDKEVNHTCTLCQRPFFAKSEWRKHQRTCKRTRHYILACPVPDCDTACTMQKEWRRHMNEAHGQMKPYACETCQALGKDVRYAYQGGLKAHTQNFHLRIRKFMCNLCEKAFYRKACLEKHQRLHDGLKPYTCDECGMRFSQRASKRAHVRNVHLKIRRFKCKYCGKAFAEKTGLRSHEAAVHGDAKAARFECEHCGKRWYEKGTYLKHKAERRCLRKQRDAKYECKECDKLFYDKTAHTRHVNKVH